MHIHRTLTRYLFACVAFAGCAVGGGGTDNTAGRNGGGGMAGEVNMDPEGGNSSGGNASGGTGDGGAGGLETGSAMNSGGTKVAGSGGTIPVLTGGSVGTGGTPIANVPCSQRAYCNDFDSATVNTQPSGSQITAGNNLGVATDKAFSGTKSLKIQASKESARFSINLAGQLKNPKKIAYARMMIWLDNTPSGKANGHWDLFGMSGKTERGNVTASVGGVQHPTISVGRWLYIGSGVDCAKQTAPQPVPTKKWSCVEVKINEEDAIPYTVRVDGKDISGLSFTTDPNQDVCVADAFKGVWYLPKVDTFTFGWNHWHTQPETVTMWIDDIVVDQIPIGCPQQ